MLLQWQARQEGRGTREEQVWEEGIKHTLKQKGIKIGQDQNPDKTRDIIRVS